jgi:transposase
MLMDIPDDEPLRGSALQRTLLSFAKYFENVLSWYGIYWDETRLYSKICPQCGSELNLETRSKNARIMVRENCGFKEERNKIPLYWALIKIKLLPTPKRDETSHIL